MIPNNTIIYFFIVSYAIRVAHTIYSFIVKM